MIKNDTNDKNTMCSIFMVHEGDAAHLQNANKLTQYTNNT